MNLMKKNKIVMTCMYTDSYKLCKIKENQVVHSFKTIKRLKIDPKMNWKPL